MLKLFKMRADRPEQGIHIQSPRQQWRMIVAFGAFVALLTTAAGFLLTKSNQLSKAAQEGSPQATTLNNGPTVASLFYDRIGTGAPTSLGKEPAVRTSKNSFTLELKVTESRSDAEALIDDLQAEGIEAYYTPLSRNGRIVYRVRRGVYRSAADAKQAAIALKQGQGIAARITQLQ